MTTGRKWEINSYHHCSLRISVLWMFQCLSTRRRQLILAAESLFIFLSFKDGNSHPFSTDSNRKSLSSLEHRMHVMITVNVVQNNDNDIHQYCQWHPVQKECCPFQLPVITLYEQNWI